MSVKITNDTGEPVEVRVTCAHGYSRGTGCAICDPIGVMCRQSEYLRRHPETVRELLEIMEEGAAEDSSREPS